MASGESENVQSMDVELKEEVMSETLLAEGTSVNPSAIPTEEFGTGTSDSGFQPRVFTAIGKFLQQDHLTDVVLISEGKSIACHKVLLGASSEYFFNKFISKNNSQNNPLEIEGISFHTLKLIISYLYTGNIKITVENAKELMSACNMFKLKFAYDICEKKLNQAADPSNCIDLYRAANLHNMPDLREKACQVMFRRFGEVTCGSEFKDMSSEEILAYIKEDNLRIPDEDAVFDAVVTWVKHDLNGRSSTFLGLLKHVRLQYCTPSHLKNVVAHEPLMESLEGQKMLNAALLNHFPNGPYVQLNKNEDCNANKVNTSTVPREGYKRMILVGEKHCYINRSGWWTLIPEVQITVNFFAACVLPKAILISGIGLKRNCWLLSTVTFEWLPAPQMKTSRMRHTCVGMEGGNVYVIGGEDEKSSVLSSMESLALEDWQTAPSLPKPLQHAMAATVDQRTCIYVFGGLDASDKTSTATFVYGENGKHWRILPNMPSACSFGAALSFKSKIFIVGGFERRCMTFDPYLNQWMTLSRCIEEHGDGPAVIWKGRLLVCGGRTRKGRDNEGNEDCTTVIEEYDAETDTWALSEMKLPKKQSGHFVFAI